MVEGLAVILAKFGLHFGIGYQLEGTLIELLAAQFNGQKFAQRGLQIIYIHFSVGEESFTFSIISAIVPPPFFGQLGSQQEPRQRFWLSPVRHRDQARERQFAPPPYKFLGRTFSLPPKIGERFHRIHVAGKRSCLHGRTLIGALTAPAVTALLERSRQPA